ncbi:hypothetical protein CLU79DRAFT_839312 [Phycomyces nitens]|nr:hypothetical protein CLU79DRAFT_839312 [Phycomyces nitens]
MPDIQVASSVKTDNTTVPILIQPNRTTHRAKKDNTKPTVETKTFVEEKDATESTPEVDAMIDTDREPTKPTTPKDDNKEEPVNRKGHKWAQSIHNAKNRLNNIEPVQAVGTTVAFFFPLIAGIFIYWQFRAIESALGKAKGVVFQGTNLIVQMAFSKICQLFQ